VEYPDAFDVKIHLANAAISYPAAVQKLLQQLYEDSDFHEALR